MKIGLIILFVISQLIKLVSNWQYSTFTSQLLAKMSAIAYTSNITKLKNWSCLQCTQYTLANVNVFENTGLKIRGFVGYSSKKQAIVISFRGTYDQKNWLLNLNLQSVKLPYCPSATVHQGFLQGFESIKEEFKMDFKNLALKYPTKKVLITGHSLGGALALICATFMVKSYPQYHLSIYTYGQPRTFNNQLRKCMPQQFPIFRVVHYGDIVPHVPIQKFGYFHIGQEIWYNTEMSVYQKCQFESNLCSKSLKLWHLSISDHKMQFYQKVKTQRVETEATQQFRSYQINQLANEKNRSKDQIQESQAQEAKRVNKFLQELRKQIEKN